MKKEIFFAILIMAFIAGISLAVSAGEMQSANYRVPTAVFSGGGAPSTSASYTANGTLGQPSPLMDPADPPISTSYDLYPGFWYTLATVPADLCEGDFEPDGDVDGTDLSLFAGDFGRTDCGSGPPCEGDFDNDGDVDGTDLSVFAADFGRLDCP